MNLKTDIEYFNLLMSLVNEQLEHMNNTYKNTNVLIDSYKQNLYDEEGKILLFDISDKDATLMISVQYSNSWFGHLNSEYHDFVIKK